MGIQEFVDEVTKGVKREVAYEKALKAIRDEADLCLNSDQNPNKGMLMRIDRIAGEALQEGGLYACATCGEPVRHYGQRCERCKASIEEDRLSRGD